MCWLWCGWVALCYSSKGVGGGRLGAHRSVCTKRRSGPSEVARARTAASAVAAAPPLLRVPLPWFDAFDVYLLTGFLYPEVAR